MQSMTITWLKSNQNLPKKARKSRSRNRLKQPRKLHRIQLQMTIRRTISSLSRVTAKFKLTMNWRHASNSLPPSSRVPGRVLCPPCSRQETARRSPVPKLAMRRFCKDSNCTRFPFQAQLNLKMFISTIILIKILPNSKSHPVKRNPRRENNNLNCHRLFMKSLRASSLPPTSHRRIWIGIRRHRSKSRNY